MSPHVEYWGIPDPAEEFSQITEAIEGAINGELMENYIGCTCHPELGDQEEESELAIRNVE